MGDVSVVDFLSLTTNRLCAILNFAGCCCSSCCRCRSGCCFVAATALRKSLQSHMLRLDLRDPQRLEHVADAAPPNDPADVPQAVLIIRSKRLPTSHALVHLRGHVIAAAAKKKQRAHSVLPNQPPPLRCPLTNCCVRSPSRLAPVAMRAHTRTHTRAGAETEVTTAGVWEVCGLFFLMYLMMSYPLKIDSAVRAAC